MAKPQLSIVIPAFNSGNTIEKCIKSILQNRTNFSYEIIVVDDGSADDTIQKVNSLSQNSGKIILKKIEHAGVQKARTVGMSIAKSDIVFFMDSDDYIASDFIQTICKKYENRKFDILLINAYFVCGTKITRLIKNDTFEFALSHSALEESIIYGKFGYNCCHVYSREKLSKLSEEKIGTLSYSEDLNLYIDFLIRQTDLTIDYLNLPLYYYCYQEEKNRHSFSEDKIKSAIFVLKKRMDLASKYYPMNFNSFREENAIVFLDLVRNLKRTTKIKSSEKAKIMMGEDFKLLSREFMHLRLFKGLKQKMKLFLYWYI